MGEESQLLYQTHITEAIFLNLQFLCFGKGDTTARRISNFINPRWNSLMNSSILTHIAYDPLFTQESRKQTNKKPPFEHIYINIEELYTEQHTTPT